MFDLQKKAWLPCWLFLSAVCSYSRLVSGHQSSWVTAASPLSLSLINSLTNMFFFLLLFVSLFQHLIGNKQQATAGWFIVFMLAGHSTHIYRCPVLFSSSTLFLLQMLFPQMPLRGASCQAGRRSRRGQHGYLPTSLSANSGQCRSAPASRPIWTQTENE